MKDYSEEFKKMIADCECPECNWFPDCADYIISYGPKKYSYLLSLESSFSQYTWCEIYECPECETIFKIEAESC